MYPLHKLCLAAMAAAAVSACAHEPDEWAECVRYRTQEIGLSRSLAERDCDEIARIRADEAARWEASLAPVAPAPPPADGAGLGAWLDQQVAEQGAQDLAQDLREASAWDEIMGDYLAEQGEKAAEAERLHELGHSYLEGRDGPPNDVEAARQFRLAADLGHAGAHVDLGAMYLDGLGVPQSDAEAFRLFRAAADMGHAGAQSALGWMYEIGRGVRSDIDEAIYWYEEAALRGDEDAVAALQRLGVW